MPENNAAGRDSNLSTRLIPQSTPHSSACRIKRSAYARLSAGYLHVSATRASKTIVGVILVVCDSHHIEHPTPNKQRAVAHAVFGPVVFGINISDIDNVAHHSPIAYLKDAPTLVVTRNRITVIVHFSDRSDIYVP